MENGQPWTIPGNQFRRHSAGRAMQLESIHTLIKSTGNQSALSLSPTSTVSEVRCSADSHQYEEYSETLRFRSCVQKPVSGRNATPSLAVPEVAKVSSGGCFDTDNWVFRRVWEHVHYMETNELMLNYFYREDRGEYGEHHTSTRGVPNLAEIDEEAGPKARGSDNHRHQERGRRVRHRCLQGEADRCTSKFILEMAQKELPQIKEIIRRIYEKQKASVPAGSDERGRRHGGKAQAANASARKLGKDDQLAAALMGQYMGFILISRLHEDLIEARNEIEDLNERVDLLAQKLQDVKLDQHQCQCQEEDRSTQQSTEAMHWRQRFEQPEAEKKAPEDEVSSLRRQLHQDDRNRGLVIPFPHCSLPPPLATTREGTTMAGVKGSPLSPVLLQSASEMQQRKRKRFALEPPTVAIQINGQHRLPLSPAPSYDSSPSPSFNSA